MNAMKAIPVGLCLWLFFAGAGQKCLADYAGSVIGVSSEASIPAGQDLTITVTVKNTGSDDWPSDFITDAPAWIITAGDPSPTPWMGFSITRYEWDSVEPGATAMDTIAIPAPACPGDYSFKVGCQHITNWWSNPFQAYYKMMANSPQTVSFRVVGPIPLPQIILQPQSQNVLIGREVHFSVDVTECGVMTFQWQKNEVNIPGATNTTLTFSATSADAGSYRVVVSNSAGASVSSPAVLTVSRELNVSLAGQWPGYVRRAALAVAVLDPLVYIAASDAAYGGGLIIMSMSNPASPQVVGRYDTSGSATGVAVSGNYAYVADGWAGLQVIDISNPASPQRVGGYDTRGSVNGVAASGNYAYVADGYESGNHLAGEGMVVVDISNPASPQRVGGYVTDGSAWDVAVSGNYAYVAGSAGLQVINISNPASPGRIGWLHDWQFPQYHAESGSARGVAVSGNYAHVAYGVAGLQVIDIANPASPQWVGGYHTSGYAYGVAVSGHYAYVADGDDGLQVIDIANPASPQRVGGDNTSGIADGVTVSGNYAYVADGDAGLQVIDIANPVSPKRVGGYHTSGGANGVAVSGNYAYVADGDAGLQVIDISNPVSPQRVGGYVTSRTASGVAVSGNYAYVAIGVGSWFESGGLQVIDISNPASPKWVGSYYNSNGSAYGKCVAVSGNYAYVAHGSDGLLLIDISNPAKPQRVGGYDTSGDARGVAVSDNYAYVADGNALQVIDISNPANPGRAGGYGTSGSALGVAVSGKYAYVADGAAGLQVIDISNPANPGRVGGYDTSGSANGVAVLGNYAYVADGSWGLAVLRLGESAGPAALGFRDWTIAGGKFQVQVVGAPGQTIVIEASSDLRNWAPLRTNTLSTLGVMDLIEPLGQNLNQRFYRLKAR